jgi:hypothetical protein
MRDVQTGIFAALLVIAVLSWGIGFVNGVGSMRPYRAWRRRVQESGEIVFPLLTLLRRRWLRSGTGVGFSAGRRTTTRRLRFIVSWPVDGFFGRRVPPPRSSRFSYLRVSLKRFRRPGVTSAGRARLLSRPPPRRSWRRRHLDRGTTAD